MTQEEEKQLWACFKEQQDEAARDELIIHYMRIVKYISGRMAIHIPSNIDMDDLIGWGTLGLIDAVEKFDHTQSTKFSTYSTIRIRGAIIDEIRTLDWAPRSLRSMARKVGSAREKLRHENGVDPRTDEIADEIDSTSKEVEDCIAKVHTAHILSLDDYLADSEDEQGRRIDRTVDTRVKAPSTEAEAQERQERIAQAILELADQQQKVLNLYYYEELTLKEIGAVLDVSESRICQVHGAALKTLREVVREHA